MRTVERSRSVVPRVLDGLAVAVLAASGVVAFVADVREPSFWPLGETMVFVGLTLGLGFAGLLTAQWMRRSQS